MKLELVRDVIGPTYTLGKLFVDGVFECFTCEDKVREVPGRPVAEWKIPGMTAIPVGTYGVTIEHSAHFGKDLPRLHGVPGYMGVLIHSGNTAEDTEGCLLVGETRTANGVAQSRLAMAKLQPEIQAALDDGEEVTITVR